ncbi:phosphatase [Clostridium sp. MCC353]|uniref:3D domain-containing protein n=1 Tax=Clostridium sp. MCC353 TaxID=2592646 RepID=UPI001C020131|nr:3D domain-containing protein [Clostridium sp. MCC353]MBT9776331.1 phosphatase [Clostridium sp. MCC353]
MIKNLIYRLRMAVLVCLFGALFSITALAAKTIDVTVTDNAAAQENETEEIGPGVPAEEKIEEPESPKAGDSLGLFTTSGYCNCEKCSKGHNLTYAGTVPQAQHTISADLNLLPLGTKVVINGIVYTVEDKGSGVNGNEIDIYYEDHDDAWDHGLQTVEVFLAE